MRRTGRLRRGDAEIYYEVLGEGPSIVFAHGLGGNHLSWWQQLAHFARTHTCVAFAHRGFLPSSAVPGNRAPDAYADDLAALIDELRLQDVALVGQSMETVAQAAEIVKGRAPKGAVNAEHWKRKALLR